MRGKILHAAAPQAGTHGRGRRAASDTARGTKPRKIFDSRTFTRTHSGPSTEKRSSAGHAARVASLTPPVSWHRGPGAPKDLLRSLSRRKFRTDSISVRLRFPGRDRRRLRRGIPQTRNLLESLEMSRMIPIYRRPYGPRL